MKITKINQSACRNPIKQINCTSLPTVPKSASGVRVGILRIHPLVGSEVDVLQADGRHGQGHGHWVAHHLDGGSRGWAAGTAALGATLGERLRRRHHILVSLHLQRKISLGLRDCRIREHALYCVWAHKNTFVKKYMIFLLNCAYFGDSQEGSKNDHVPCRIIKPQQILCKQTNKT